MCEEISILRRWQHVSDRAPCHCLTSVTRPCTLMRGLTSSFDRNFLVILLVLHTSKWVRCHLDASSQSEVEVIETVLATLPSRHVSRYMAKCWLWLGDFYHHHHHHHHRSHILQVLETCKILVGKLSPRSTQCTPLHSSKITFFQKFAIILPKFAKF